MGMLRSAVGVAAVLAMVAGVPGRASASTVIPSGWLCTVVNTCGTLGADGDITAPPGGSQYQYITTNVGANGVGQLPGIGGTNGALLTTSPFVANGTDTLTFNFNFVTSDGTGSFPDYAWAELVPSVGSPTVLFDARTVAGAGNTVPGFGLPPITVSLSPPSTAIIPGATNWSALGGSSGQCYQGPGQGCGNTGWITATTTPAAGTYTLQFGVSNFGDTQLDTGLAISGATIGVVPIDNGPGPGAPVPEPGPLLLFGSGLVAVARKVRSRRRSA